jgi:CubicO group peptidase (beta-lactamase class C family)
MPRLFSAVLLIFTFLFSPLSGRDFPGSEWKRKTPESQGISSERLNKAMAYLGNQCGEHGTMQAVVIRHGYMIWKGEDIDTMHNVWSCSKSFTSTVLGLLIDDGKCRLETRAKDCLRGLEILYPDVTLQHFATMTSGYDAIGGAQTQSPYEPAAPLFFPGTRFKYHDCAMNQFGHVLTRIAGESMEELFRRRIADPIGMDPAKWDWHDWGSIDGLVINGGAGNKSRGIHISARELARFGLLFLNRGNWDGKQLIPDSWVDMATSIQVASDLPPFDSLNQHGPGTYGFNWWVNGNGPEGIPKWPSAPRGTFAALGHNNNVCLVIPEWDMVIVRLGTDGNIPPARWDAFLGMISAAFLERVHSTSPDHVIPVTGPGIYAKPGTTYRLANDISSDRSTIFLGKDVTLDLNGYTLSYADGYYEHVPNYGFEEGLKGWDVSKAPGAKIESTEKVHEFIGDSLLSLKAGDEIASSYINLPVEERSYYAMCGITGHYYHDMGGDVRNDMRISVYVNNEAGEEVKCLTRYADSTMISCPVENRSARLGGGFIVAHLNNLPAGRYRIRVKAENDCLVDQIDIRPAMDVGIGIVDVTHPMGHTDHLYNLNHSAFFDYTADASTGEPLNSIPRVEGRGTVTIKNGVIKSGTRGVLSWGIQSTAKDVRIILDNVKFITSGINTTAVDVPHATITNCRFEVESPFIINRHGSEFYAVDLRGTKASEVSYSEFYGGQGCLVFKGKHSIIHHNLFVNRQTVTNHYSIMAMGDSSMVFENRFEPEIGSGLEIFRHKYIDIFNNVFRIEAAPPSCEYHEHYSTNAIRVADYGAEPGHPRGCYGNRIYNNEFHIRGRKFENYPDYIPMASAFFFSTSAGENYIFGNEIFINQEDPDSDAEAYAFYIGGRSLGGQLYNNHITTNVTPMWVASGYGSATGTVIARNCISRSVDIGTDFPAVRMGWIERTDCLARDIEFRSNVFEGLDFTLMLLTGRENPCKVSK